MAKITFLNSNINMQNIRNLDLSKRASRYYAIFKVRKFEWLFYKISTCLQTACIGLRAEQIFLVNK